MIKRTSFAITIAIIAVSLFICYKVFYVRTPKLVYPEGKIYDFGFVNEGEIFRHEFVLKNEGNAELKIGNIKTGCGCTNAHINTKIIEPGKSETLIVEYKGRPVQEKEILPVWITTNDPRSPLAQLVLTGNVRTKVFWYPKSVSFHCKQDLLAQQQREVQFLSRNADKFEVIDIFSSSKQILVSCEKNEEGIKCKIKPDVTLPIGNSSEKINIKFQIDDEVKKVDVPVHLMIH